MKKILSIAFAALIGFASCAKEDTGTKGSNENTDLITTITAGTGSITKVIMNPGDGENITSVDELVWAGTDLIYFWEMTSISNFTNTVGANNPGYMPTGNKVIFKLVSGVGKKSGVFSPQTAGEGLDPNGVYVASHCATSSRIYFDDKILANGDAGTRNVLRIAAENSSTMSTVTSDLVSPKLAFFAKVSIGSDGNIPALDFRSISCVLEYRLYQDPSLAGDYTIKNLNYTTTPRYLTLSQSGYNFTNEMEPNLRHASALYTYNLTVGSSGTSIVLSKDPTKPTVLRYPILTRLDLGTGNYSGGGTFKHTFTLNLNDGTTDVVKTFTSQKTAPTGMLAFPGNTTIVKTIVVSETM